MVQAQLDADYRRAPDNKDLRHIEGEYGYPLVGVALEMVEDLLGFARRMQAQYGNIARIQLSTQKGVFVVGADNYQRIYLDKDRSFSAEMGYASQLGTFYPGGLLLRDFDEHRFQRRIMQSAFKTPAMQQYVQMMNPVLQAKLASWGNGKELVFFPFVKEALLEVGARIFIGLDEYGEEAELLNRSFNEVNEGLGSILRFAVPGTSYHRGLRGRDRLADFFTRLIPERRNGDGQDMLSFMCREKSESGEVFPAKDIMQHAAFLLFAAHDTTTSVLSHMIMYLGQHPQWQQRLREDALALGKEWLEYEDLDSLENLDRAFQECLRLHPSVPLMTRRTTRDVEIEGVNIQANTMLFMPSSYNQRDPQYWTDPDSFDPDRFAPGREEHKRHSFCYHPFGGGAHKCIGLHFASMLTKCFMHQLLINYRFETPAGYAPKLQWVPLPKPADGVPIKVSRL